MHIFRKSIRLCSSTCNFDRAGLSGLKRNMKTQSQGQGVAIRFNTFLKYLSFYVERQPFTLRQHVHMLQM